MKNVSKIILNLAISFIIISFVWYIAASVGKESSPGYVTGGDPSEPFVSPYIQVASFELSVEINCFELFDNRLFILSGQSVYIFDTEGKQLADFSVEPDVMDITVKEKDIYLLYPTRIELYSFDGKQVRQWEACSELSGYCSLTIAGDAVFVTDAENKNICKYTTEGDFVKFIQSPHDFIIPSYNFDIDCWNDTIYCVNSGRHLIESYTLQGDFIAAFGGPGSETGFFSGCCNPAYISFSPNGGLITSEKGNPRVKYYERNGKFKEMLFNSKMLGGGNKACMVKATDDRLFVTSKNKVLVYRHDTELQTTCNK